MARHHRRPEWTRVFVFMGLPLLLLLLLSLACCSASPPTEGRVRGRSPEGLLRNRRQVCADGTYEHDGVTCCLCAAGMKLKDHCVSTQVYGNCTLCDRNTYNAHPNSKTSCDPCTSCDQPNANLEVEDICTAGGDTRCRCKKDHFCILKSLDSPGQCRICQPCKTCPAGVEIACTATNDTVCQEEDENRVGKAIGITLAILIALIGAIGLAVFLRRKRRQRPPEREETLLCRDLQPYLIEIVDVVGWKDMKAIALASKIPRATIEFCERDNPRDAQQQTLQLLETWIESEGRNASKNLIQMLRKNHKNGKADRLIHILSGDSETA
ncbi:hypothetical protein Q5P01_021564 [Channa striata]|uniref:Apoptosis-mediating surface antigen FAS n=1 Tax=Channa striata TaxID=64152 RepID=A0AA88LUE5_CHASR|nr:hypothetical protein Q5P01_021564 [Channa striata]